MRLGRALTTVICLSLSAAPWRVSAEELKGAARRAYETATRQGDLWTSCSAGSPDFVLWAGEAPSVIEAGGASQPVRFQHHRVGDFIHAPYRCRTASGLLTLTTKLTHSISNSQCGAGEDFKAKVAVANLGSYSDDFLVEGCGGTSGLLVRGRHVLLCRMPDGGEAGVGRCVEAADSVGPRRLR